MAKPKTLVGVKIEKTVTTKKSFNLNVTNAELVQLLQECSIIPCEIDPHAVEVYPHPWDDVFERMDGIALSWEETTVETT